VNKTEFHDLILVNFFNTPLPCGPLQVCVPPPQLRVLRCPKHGTVRHITLVCARGVWSIPETRVTRRSRWISRRNAVYCTAQVFINNDQHDPTHGPRGHFVYLSPNSTMPTSPWRPRQVRDKPVTSPLAQIPLRRLPRNFPGREVSGKSA